MKTLLTLIALFFLSVNASFSQTILWDKTYGGNDRDYVANIFVTSTNDLLIVGSSSSEAGYEKSESSIDSDYWIIKTDPQGMLIWDYTIGGFQYDATNEALLDARENIIILGNSTSSIGGDKSQNNRSGVQSTFPDTDYWLVKVKMPRDINPELLLDIREEHLVATCWHCHIWPGPWELWQDFQYRFWPVKRGVKNAVYRNAFRGRHRDRVAWVDETSLSIRLHDRLPPGDYQFQLRAQLRDRSYSDWLAPLAFTVEGMNVKVFPNPVRNLLNIHYQASYREVVRIVLMNRYGKIIWAQKRAARRGRNQWRLKVPRVRAHNNPLTLQIFSPTQGKQSWQLIRE